MKTIPVVDLAKIKSVDKDIIIAGKPEWKEAAEKIRDGLGGIGFLYLINHGVPEETIANAFSESKRFFELPLDTKLKFKKDVKGAESGTFDMRKYCGYMPLGGEVLNARDKFDVKETYDWVSTKYSMPSDETTSRFHESITQLESECKLLYKKMLKLLALSLNLNEDFFLNSCLHLDDEENYVGLANMRFLHYPKIESKEAAQPGTVRCGEHSDYGFLTMLFQDDCGGLEVQTVDGEWVEAKPIPGSVLVNTGNLVEFWTSGIFPATKHRIRIPDVDDERRMKDRYSIAAFSGPDCQAIVTPMDLEKRPQEMKRLINNGIVYTKEPISAYDYMMALVAKQYNQNY